VSEGPRKRREKSKNPGTGGGRRQIGQPAAGFFSWGGGKSRGRGERQVFRPWAKIFLRHTPQPRHHLAPRKRRPAGLQAQASIGQVCANSLISLPVFIFARRGVFTKGLDSEFHHRGKCCETHSMSRRFGGPPLCGPKKKKTNSNLLPLLLPQGFPKPRSTYRPQKILPTSRAKAAQFPENRAAPVGGGPRQRVRDPRQKVIFGSGPGTTTIFPHPPLQKKPLRGADAPMKFRGGRFVPPTLASSGTQPDHRRFGSGTAPRNDLLLKSPRSSRSGKKKTLATVLAAFTPPSWVPIGANESAPAFSPAACPGSLVKKKKRGPNNFSGFTRKPAKPNLGEFFSATAPQGNRREREKPPATRQTLFVESAPPEIGARPPARAAWDDAPMVCCESGRPRGVPSKTPCGSPALRQGLRISKKIPKFPHPKARRGSGAAPDHQETPTQT